MKIEKTLLDDQQVKIIAELEPELMEGFKVRAAKRIAKNTKIAGFRPGKAPYDVIRRQYGDAAIEQEAVEIMLDEIYPKILDEAEVKPSGSGNLEEIISMDPPKFAFVVPLEPEVELYDYHSMRRDYAFEPVTEDEYQSVLTNIRRSYATAEPVERPIEDGDMVYIKISGEFTEPLEGENKEVISERPFQVYVDKEAKLDSEWPYQGFSKELIGKNENDEQTITHIFPHDSNFENLRDKEVAFKVTIQSVKKLTLPALDDEFAKTMGEEYENFEQLDKAIRSQVEDEKKKNYEQDFFTDLLKEVVKNSTVKYPKHMLDEEIHQIMHNFEHDLSHQHMDLAAYLKTRKLDEAQFIEQEIKPDAEIRLKRNLVMDKIAHEENIQLDNAELQQEIQATMLNYMRNGYQLPKIERERENFTNMIAYQAANRLINKGILDRLKQIATGIEPEKAEPVAEDEGEAVAEEPAVADEAPTTAPEQEDQAES